MLKKKVMFISSTGGHLEELLRLKSLFNDYDYSLITEKTKSNLNYYINILNYYNQNKILYIN